MVKISPSILAGDFSRLGAELSAMERAGADMIHLDVMDGHFVPNISFGAPVIKSLRKGSGLFFDTHLMISDPLRYIGDFAGAGANLITFHIESESDPAATIAAIKARGKLAGLSLKPKTPAEALFPFLGDIDLVLVMTVEPGFGGQKFMPDMLPKIRELRREAENRGLAPDIQVDGGIDAATARLVCEAGANVLVAGSSLFSQPDYKAALDELRRVAGDDAHIVPH